MITLDTTEQPRPLPSACVLTCTGRKSLYHSVSVLHCAQAAYVSGRGSFHHGVPSTWLCIAQAMMGTGFIFILLLHPLSLLLDGQPTANIQRWVDLILN